MDFVATLRISDVHCSVAEMNLGRENFSFIWQHKCEKFLSQIFFVK